MEHTMEGLYMAAAAALFMLAVSLMFMVGRSVDNLFAAEQAVSLTGDLLWEEEADE